MRCVLLCGVLRAVCSVLLCSEFGVLLCSVVCCVPFCAACCVLLCAVCCCVLRALYDNDDGDDDNCDYDVKLFM